jgi:hypothetical protein
MTRMARERVPPSRSTLATAVTLLAALLVVPLALAPRAESFIYWTDGNSIARANLDGTGVDQLFIAGAGSSSDLPQFGGVAVDASHIYWTGPNGIGRANLDGSGFEPSFIPGVVDAAWHDLAVDASHVYWTYYYCGPGPTSDFECNGAIGRANLDGTGVDPTFIDGVIAGSVAIDARFIYWTDLGPANSAIDTPGDTPDTIGRANLDGTDAETSFISVPPGEAPELHGLAVDANHIYWTQVGLSGLRGTIARADLDGTNVDQSFIPVNPAFDIAIDATHVYWVRGVPLGSHGPPAIGRANLDGTGAVGFFISPAGGGLAVDGLTDTELAGNASAARTQRQTGKRIVVRVRVKAKERLTAKATGKVKVNPTYKLKPKTVEVVESHRTDTQVQTKTLKLKPKKTKAKKIAKDLKRGEKGTARLKVKLTDLAANRETERLRVRLRR